MKTIRRGFTLLELLIVIGLIGILVTVASASYSSTQKKTRDNRRISDMKAWQDALEQYMAETGTYPDADPSTCNPGPDYLPAGIPRDPQPNAAEPYSITTCTNNPASAYCICARMETATAGNSNTTSCTFGSGSPIYYCVRQRL